LGDALTVFVEGLQERHRAYDPAKYQGKIVPIWQSSATGKSRLIAEYAKTVGGARVLQTRVVTFLVSGSP
jgi:hypothetical protein